MDPVLGQVLIVAGSAGGGAAVKSVADGVFSRKRRDADLAAIAVQISSTVLREVRVELEDTRQELAATRDELAKANEKLQLAHDEIDSLRTELSAAREEISSYRKGK